MLIRVCLGWLILVVVEWRPVTRITNICLYNHNKVQRTNLQSIIQISKIAPQNQHNILNNPFKKTIKSKEFWLLTISKQEHNSLTYNYPDIYTNTATSMTIDIINNQNLPKINKNRMKYLDIRHHRQGDQKNLLIHPPISHLHTNTNNIFNKRANKDILIDISQSTLPNPYRWINLCILPINRIVLEWKVGLIIRKLAKLHWALWWLIMRILRNRSTSTNDRSQPKEKHKKLFPSTKPNYQIKAKQPIPTINLKINPIRANTRLPNKLIKQKAKAKAITKIHQNRQTKPKLQN